MLIENESGKTNLELTTKFGEIVGLFYLAKSERKKQIISPIVL